MVSRGESSPSRGGTATNDIWEVRPTGRRALYPSSCILPGHGAEKAELYEDARGMAQNPKYTALRQQNVCSNNALILHPASGGGTAI